MVASRTVKIEIHGDVNNFNRALLNASTHARGLARDLDTTSSQMGLLVSSGLALGPALVPIGASVTPVITGLASQLGFAAASAGVAVLAFTGMGKALKSVNDYQLDPTADTLEKMREGLSTLGPAGQDFLMFLQQLRPQMQDLKETSRAGLFPGLERGMEDFMSMMPQVERIISNVAVAMGDLADQAGETLAGPRWEEFFNYLETDARPTLMAFGQTLGNFTEGIANLFVAFAPASDQFSESFLRMSRSFADWTANLPETDGFQSFLTYLADVGPKVWDTLSAIGGAMMSLLEAAAPVGSILLPVLTQLSHAFSALMDTDIGPVLMGAVVAINSVAMAMKLSGLANFGIMGKSIKSSALLFGGLELNAKRAGRAVDAAGKHAKLGGAGFYDLGGSADYAGRRVKDMGAGLHKAGSYAEEAGSHAQRAGARAKSGGTSFLTFGNAAANAGRSASGASAGFRKAGAYAQTAGKHATEMRTSFSRIGGSAVGVGALVFAMSDFDEKMGLTNASTGAMIGMLAGPWGVAVGAGAGLLMDFAAANNDTGDAVARLDAELRKGVGGYDAQVAALENLKKKNKEYEDDRYKTFPNPLDMFGDAKNSLEGIFGTSQVDENAGAYRKGAKAVRDMELAKDQARAAELGMAADMSGTTGSLREQTLAVFENMAAHNKRANQALTALDKEVAWQRSIDAASESLKKNGVSVDSNTAAGQSNLTALSGMIKGWNELPPAIQASEGMYDSAHAKITKMADAMGYSREKASALATEMMNMPPDITAEFRAIGIKATTEQVLALRDQYELTPDQVETQLLALNLSGPAIAKIMADLERVDRERANPTIGVNDQASRKIRQIRGLIDTLTGKKVTIETVYKRTIINGRGNPGVFGGNKADGGELRGPGGPRDDLIPIMASNKEILINAHDAQQHRNLLLDINSGKYRYAKMASFADGGEITRYQPMPQRFGGPAASGSSNVPAGATTQRTLIYHAAPGPSLSAEEKLFEAGNRARLVF